MNTYSVIKRAIDIVLSFSAIVLLWPVLLVITILIKIDSKGPVLFKQKRIGQYKKEFYMLKIRTMRMGTPKDLPTHMFQNPDAYVTKIGRFLRKSSLDELPQIINIFKGEMSIIGPRPALWNQYDLIAERDKYGVNDFVPGLTGWAQVNGRDELPIPVKSEFDGYYTKNISFLLDVKIFFMSIFNVATAKGVIEGKEENVSIGK